MNDSSHSRLVPAMDIIGDWCMDQKVKQFLILAAFHQSNRANINRPVIITLNTIDIRSQSMWLLFFVSSGLQQQYSLINAAVGLNGKYGGSPS